MLILIVLCLHVHNCRGGENTTHGSVVKVRRMREEEGDILNTVLVLHDAFFEYQTKPELPSLGDLYHEGKEFEHTQIGHMGILIHGNLSSLLMEVGKRYFCLGLGTCS